jgi:uncharacterized protein YndB with AHSA1/START domain
MLKRTLLSIAAIIVVALIVVLVAASRQPDTFRVERRATIAAPPATVFAYLEDFRRWSTWSPWEKLDPAMEKTFGGPPKGVGATYAWNGNDEVGRGSMTILESRPSERLEIRLEFFEPWEAIHTNVFTLAPQGAGTEVTWAMEGENAFMSKVFSVIMNMEDLVGAEFEQGLADLGAVAEAEAASSRD